MTLPTRVLGRTGVTVSQLGFGASHVQREIEPKLIKMELIRIMDRRHITANGMNYIKMENSK